MTPTLTEIAEEMKEKGVGVGFYAGIGTGISLLLLLRSSSYDCI